MPIIRSSRLLLLPHIVCNALVAGGGRSGARQQAMHSLLPGTSPKNYTISDRGHLKCDGTRSETRFSLSAKRTFKSAGASVQSTTGSRVVRISSGNGGYTMFRGSVKCTGYPLHSPVSTLLRLSCVTVCHHISAGV